MEYKLRIGYKPMIIIFQYCLDILCRSHRELSGIIKLFLSVTYSIWKTKASQFGFKLKETGIFRSPYVILIIWCCDLSIHLGSSISCKGLSGKELMTYYIILCCVITRIYILLTAFYFNSFRFGYGFFIWEKFRQLWVIFFANIFFPRIG